VVKTLIAGRAPILDFDGTLARLEVPWSELRSRLGVNRIQDLWLSADDVRWAEVTEAEVDAAKVAEPMAELAGRLDDVDGFAILTSNSSDAVETFLERFPDLGARAVLVVGREILGGPKTSFEVFARGYAMCVEALGRPQPPTYIGDQPYELEFAKRLGATAINVATLGVTNV
jgi:phosphoglycolate phosphatase-like HAD superfamily hydrolase